MSGRERSTTNPKERQCTVCDCWSDLFITVTIAGCFEGMNEAPSLVVCMRCASEISLHYCAGFSAGC